MSHPFMRFESMSPCLIIFATFFMFFAESKTVDAEELYKDQLVSGITYYRGLIYNWKVSFVVEDQIIYDLRQRGANSGQGKRRITGVLDGARFRYSREFLTSDNRVERTETRVWDGKIFQSLFTETGDPFATKALIGTSPRDVAIFNLTAVQNNLTIRFRPEYS